MNFLFTSIWCLAIHIKITMANLWLRNHLHKFFFFRFLERFKLSTLTFFFFFFFFWYYKFEGEGHRFQRHSLCESIHLSSSKNLYQSYGVIHGSELLDLISVSRGTSYKLPIQTKTLKTFAISWMSGSVAHNLHKMKNINVKIISVEKRNTKLDK